MSDAGYAIHGGVFTRAQTDAFTSQLASQPLTRSRAGARHLMSNVLVRELAQGPRMLALAASWLAGSAVPFKATLFDKSPDANWLVAWHQDTAVPLCMRRDTKGWGPWSEKEGVIYAHAPARALERIVALRVHLDDSDSGNGALRVLPGTHERGVLTEVEVHDCAQQVDPIECAVPAGGVLAMRPLLIHASSKVTSARPRRVLHIEYAASLDLPDGLELRVA